MLLLTLCLFAPPELAPPPRPAQRPRHPRLVAFSAETTALGQVRDAEATAVVVAGGVAEAAAVLRYEADYLKVMDRLLAFAKHDPASDAGFDALDWLACVRFGRLPQAAEAVHYLTVHHFGRPEMARTCNILRHPAGRDPAPLALLRKVAADSPHRAARASAALGLAEALAAREAPEAEAALEAVARDFADLPYHEKTSYGDRAAALLFELRHLSVGRVAPNLAGDDLDGRPLSLTDSRGKVVLLVFWAGWCGPCMADVPHEKELAGRFARRPFAVVGVNGDRTRTAAADAVAKAGIPWRSVWAGPAGPAGPIPTRWNVNGWPTVYVLDHTGIIRHKGLRGGNLDAPLAELVAEAERAMR